MSFHPNHPYRRSLPVRYSGAQYLFRQSVRLTPLSLGQLSASHSTVEHLKTAQKNGERKKVACFHPANILRNERKKAANVRDAQYRSTLILSFNPKWGTKKQNIKKQLSAKHKTSSSPYFQVHQELPTMKSFAPPRTWAKVGGH